MSESIAAEIEIGGPVPADLVNDLIGAIQTESVHVTWAEEPFRATTAEELLELAANNSKHPGVLQLVDVEASYGQFDVLEAWLVEHGVAFDRRSEAKYEHAAELVQFRPGMKAPLLRYTDDQHRPVVRSAELKSVRRAVQTGKLPRALRLLDQLIGPTIPALKPLRISVRNDRQPGARAGSPIWRKPMKARTEGGT